MIGHAAWLADSNYLFPLNLFRYITFRPAGGGDDAQAVFFFGPAIIAVAVSKGKGPADPRGRAAVASSDQEGTPTMGGLMILSGLIAATCCGQLRNPYVWVVLLS